jgi:hypothetical protein
MFAPDNCVGRNDFLDFLTPGIMTSFAIVLWARGECYIGSRMQMHTRAYVTKKPHVRARLHMCRSSVAGPGLQAPCDIRPRPLTNAEPHAWCLRALRPLHLARASIMAGSWAWGHAACCSWASASAGPGRTQARPAKALPLAARTQPKASRAAAKETRPHHGKSADSYKGQQQGRHGQGPGTAAGQGKESHSQEEKERYWYISNRFRVSRHGEC